MKYQVNNCSVSIKLKHPRIMRVVYRSFNCSLLPGSNGRIKRWKNIEVNKRKELLNSKDLEFKKIAKGIFEKLNKRKFVVEKLLTENNELYGSVKPTEISKLILNKENIEIKPSQIDLVKEIKTIGDFVVKLNLHSEVQASIIIQVNKTEEQK